MSDWDSDAGTGAQRNTGLRGQTDQSVDDLYNGKGFYFRQRRGRLNLRKLDQIDMDRMIREVDVDLLQQHLEDLTFCLFKEDDLQFFSDRQVVKMFRLSQMTIEYLLYSQGQLVNNLSELSNKYALKKKLLHRKRRELTGLKEEVDSLHSQLRAKRRNLSTLEKLVRDASKLKPAPTSDTADKPSSGMLKFFVSLPNNMFMELEERPSTSIRNIISQAMNVVVSDPAFDDTLLEEDGKNSLRLFCKGKLLLNDCTLENYEIKSGDTLVANFVSKSHAKPRPQAQPLPASAPAPEVRFVPQEVDSGSRAMVSALGELLAKQVKSMEVFAQEVTNATTKMAAAKQEERPVLDESKILGHMDEKLRNIEQEIKDNLSRVTSIQQQRSLVFGELENDNEDLSNAIKDINSQLRQSFTKMDSITGQVQDTSSAIGRIGDALRAQQDQLTELRASLGNLKFPSAAPVIIHQPAAAAPVVIRDSVSPPPQVVTLPKDTISLKSSKWNHLMTDDRRVGTEAVKTMPVVQAAPVQVEVMDFAPPRKEVVIKAPPKVEVKPEPLPAKPAPVEVKELPKEVVLAPKVVPKDTTVTFSMEQNSDLRAFNVVKVVATLQPTLPADEIIFSLRKAISTKVALPFSSVSLLLDRRVIKLGVDVPKGLPFSSQDVQQYADSGRLSLRLQKPKTVSDAQIDALLVPAWQSDVAVRSSASSKASGVTNDEATKALDAVEPNIAGVRKALDGFNTLRLSLDDMLRDLADKPGLTDDEMIERRAQIEAYSSQSEVEAESFRKYRHSLVGAVGAAAAADSGAENARRHTNFLRGAPPSARSSQDLQRSASLRSSADLGPVLRLRHSHSTDAKAASSGTGHDDEGMMLRTQTLRRSWEAAEGGRGGVYSSLDDVPMLSSLSQPLPMSLRTALNSSHVSAGSKKRYDEDPVPSFVSSLGDDTADSGRLPAYRADAKLGARSEDKSMESSWRDSLSQSHFSGANTTLTTTLALDQTLDSEADVLGRGVQIDARDVQRGADAYERVAAARSRLDSMSDEGEGEGVSIMESPFKSYGQPDADTGSVNSLALSDSHNTID